MDGSKNNTSKLNVHDLFLRRDVVFATEEQKRQEESAHRIRKSIQISADTFALFLL